jgi:hypothetical protein
MSKLSHFAYKGICTSKSVKELTKVYLEFGGVNKGGAEKDFVL